MFDMLIALAISTIRPLQLLAVDSSNHVGWCGIHLKYIVALHGGEMVEGPVTMLGWKLLVCR